MLAELASNRGRFSHMMQSLVKAADALHGVVPGDYASISIDVHLDGIRSGNLPALQGLLDLIGITAPIADVIDGLGLGDTLGGLLGRSAANESSPGTAQQPGGPGRGDGPDSPLPLDNLLGGLLGGRG